MKLKHFKKERNVYHMKPQYSSSILLIFGLFLFAFGAYYAEIYGLMWVMLLLGILSFWATVIKKLSIDKDKRRIQAKVGLLKPSVSISIDAIQHFELFTMSNNLITTNAMLNVYYLNEDGKEKTIQLAQGFTVKAMQSILNELEDILEYN